MYAVIENGGKQYRVELGSELVLDRMDVETGQTVTFDHVLLVADGDVAAIGRPHVAGALVSADVVRQARGEKVVVFKYRPKARSRVKQGARADLTVLRVADITHDGKSAAKIAEQARTERQRLEAAEAEAAA
ncbi:MAG TPA: 50S ribosomal protein L21, partial [Candidatus Sulfotelmatobacter sp.]|nr:50S ribosomal protein L21 [Candidatus Sulfotelmatobacter sp.]